MWIYLGGIALLILSYFTWAVFLEKVFTIDRTRQTPAYRKSDGVDYVALPTWKVYLIQLLNIAGLGPIFGALQGALWGPAAYLWIIFGCIFGGAVHDYMSGMISHKHDGASISEIHGMYLGRYIQQGMRVFTIVMMVLVGVVFVTGPAKLMAMITPDFFYFKSYYFWIVVIFIYYFLATVIPIDKIIGRIYPIFGLALLIMVIGVGVGIIVKGYTFPPFTLKSMHPQGIPIWTTMFITIACGALSGFHATQSPLMARCMKNEKHGRVVFYGAMVSEGMIAMVWATVGMVFYRNGIPELFASLNNGGPNTVVYNSCIYLMGPIGGVLAILGVVACPITTGDTAFRAARLTVAEIFNIDQRQYMKRFLIAIPMFATGIWLCSIDFSLLWRYFAWMNQFLGMVTLWACSVYLYKYKGNYHWITTFPAIFMTAVTVTYILTQKIGFNLPIHTGSLVNIFITTGFLVLFLTLGVQYSKRIPVLAENIEEDK